VKIDQAAGEFLTSKRFAVTGVSRNPEGHGGNAVYARMKERGLDVVPINPNADAIDGQPCYPDLAAVPGGVDAVVIGTAAEHALGTMQEVIDLGITKVWMHRAFGPGSVSPEASELGRANGVLVIDGGCPLMFGATADGGHKFMCALLKLTGAVPRTVA